MTKPASIWTDELVERLKEFAKQNYSCGEIAVQFGNGMTRNAVIGKMHRLGISTGNKKGFQKSDPTAPKRRSNYGSQVQRLRLRIANQIEGIKDQAIEFLREPDEIVPLHIGLMDLTATTCRWPFGDLPPFTFCGCEKIADGPYCYGHSLIATVPTQPKKRVYHSGRTRERRAA